MSICQKPCVNVSKKNSTSPNRPRLIDLAGSTITTVPCCTAMTQNNATCTLRMQAASEHAYMLRVSSCPRKLHVHQCSRTRRPCHTSASASLTEASIEDATAITTKRMPETTVGKCPRVKPTEYTYTKQMKPGVPQDQPDESSATSPA